MRAFMIVRKHLDIRKVVRHQAPSLLVLGAYAVAVVVAYETLGVAGVAISSVPIGAIASALAILIGFRTNNAYDRWWEARRLWGEIVNRSRTLGREVVALLGPGFGPDTDEATADDWRRELLYRQIAFAYALRQHLRRLDPLEGLDAFLAPAELEALRGSHHVPNALLTTQAVRLRDAREAGYLEDFRLMQFDDTLGGLTDAMGGCERIKNTVFPRQYSYYTHVFTWVFLLMLPPALVAQLGWVDLPATLVVGFIFIALARLGDAIETPFENHYNDTPMTAIARGIERDLRAQLGETELPPPVEPVDGFLY